MDGVGLQEAGRFAGVWIVAGDALALRAWVLHLRFVDFLGLLAVAGDAQRFGVDCVRTTFPSFGGAWQVSQVFDSNGVCANAA